MCAASTLLVSISAVIFLSVWAVQALGSSFDQSVCSSSYPHCSFITHTKCSLCIILTRTYFSNQAFGSRCRTTSACGGRCCLKPCLRPRSRPRLPFYCSVPSRPCASVNSLCKGFFPPKVSSCVQNQTASNLICSVMNFCRAGWGHSSLPPPPRPPLGP